jgi:hypothetical protein
VCGCLAASTGFIRFSKGVSAPRGRHCRFSGHCAVRVQQDTLCFAPEAALMGLRMSAPALHVELAHVPSFVSHPYSFRGIRSRNGAACPSLRGSQLPGLQRCARCREDLRRPR